MYNSYSFTTSALDEVEWSASRPRLRLTPGERTPGTHCTGGWVDPRETGHKGKMKNLLPLPGIEHRSPSRPVRSQTLTDWATRVQWIKSYSCFAFDNTLISEHSTIYRVIGVSYSNLETKVNDKSYNVECWPVPVLIGKHSYRQYFIICNQGPFNPMPYKQHSSTGCNVSISQPLFQHTNQAVTYT
jgi:hypothetical protein